jgi:CBS domain-containing membrane protein
MRFEKIRTTLQHLIPPPLAIGWPERVRACAGGLFGIFITSFLTALIFPGESREIAWLVAPIGASSVLLFATPASPLAQPWSIIGGNLISALIGITCARWIQLPMLACALAVAGSIAAMLALRCLHPPGGAVALTAVLGGPAVHAAGYDLLWFPIGVNCLLIVGLGLFFHNATGHRYPHRLPAPPVAQPATLHINRDDIGAAMREMDEILDIEIDDLEQLLRRAEIHALARLASTGSSLASRVESARKKRASRKRFKINLR